MSREAAHDPALIRRLPLILLGGLAVLLAPLPWLGDLRTSASTRIVIICRTDKRSSTAQAVLRAAGFNGVTVLRGGMERWNNLNFATVGDVADGKRAMP